MKLSADEIELAIIQAKQILRQTGIKLKSSPFFHLGTKLYLRSFIKDKIKEEKEEEKKN